MRINDSRKKQSLVRSVVNFRSSFVIENEDKVKSQIYKIHHVTFLLFLSLYSTKLIALTLCVM